MAKEFLEVLPDYPFYQDADKWREEVMANLGKLNTSELQAIIGYLDRLAAKAKSSREMGELFDANIHGFIYAATVNLVSEQEND